MGIFDVFKTKVSGAADKAGDVAGQAWDKAGDVAGQAKDKVSDMMDKKKGEAADPSAPPAAHAPAGAEAEAEARASTMVSEGAPVATAGEAAPGVGDDGAPPQDSAGGMTQSIKGNVAGGAGQAGEMKAGEMAEGATGNRFEEKIDSRVRQAKDKLG